MQMNNFIKDRNPLDLAPPPAWWLKKLWEFDDSLVVVPSRMTYCYRLCQRRAPDKRTNLVHDLQADSDSQMLRSYNMVPVTTIVANPRWDNPVMFEDLRQRMPSRMGGAEKFEAALLSKEQQVKLRERAEREDMLDQVAKDSLKFYNMKRGVRSHLWSPSVPNKPERPTFSKAPMIKVASQYSKLRG
jgi:hypothetical protein